MKVLTTQDVRTQVLDGMVVSVIGYGAQGRAQALCFKDSGLQVLVGVRQDGVSWEQARRDGFEPVSIAQAADLILSAHEKLAANA